MIEINLLPDDLRRPGSASPRTLGMLVAAAVLSSCAVVGFAYVYFDLYTTSDAKFQLAQEQFENLVPQQDYAQTLENEARDFRKRHTIIEEIASSRVQWSRKMDALCKIVNQDVQSGRHQIWFDQLDMDSGNSRRGGVKLKGFSGGAHVLNVSNFHADMQQDETFADGFVDFTSPPARLAEVESEYQPAEKMEFSFDALMPELPKGQSRRKR